MAHGFEQVFALVCGQDPAHTWMPGGSALPVCQRCTGLYLGALAAGLLLWALRPVRNRNFRLAHAGFLVLMIPLGFHWVPQNSLARTASGFLFGAAIMVFLTLPAGGWWTGQGSSRRFYAAGLALGIPLVWLAGARGGLVTGYVLSGLAAAGALALAAAIVFQVAILLCALRQRRIRPAS